MKKDVLHKVPLSTQVLEILAYVRERSDPSDPRVFPTKGKGKHITDKALSCLLKDLQIACVPHGLRKSLRTWAAEQENPPILEHAAEMLLAHKPKESIVAIYMTSTFYEHRIPVMQRWADYVAETMGAVVPTTPQASKPPKREKTENARVQISKANRPPRRNRPEKLNHAPAPQKQITPDYSQDSNPMMQNWDRLLARDPGPGHPGDGSPNGRPVQ